MNRYVIAGVGGLVVVFISVWMFVGTSPSADVCATNPKPRIVAFGDSLIEGVGASKGEGLVDHLSRAVGVEVENYGISGNTTKNGRDRIGSLLKTNPDIVLVLLGGNDALQNVPVATTRENIEVILEEIQKSGATPVLLGVRGGFPQDPFRGMFSELSEAYDILYVSNVLSGIIGRSEYMYDSVHPNAAGYEKMSERISSTLRKACMKHRL